ncbi:hypothetical protein [Kibdelosporangium phytohabitans]|uniref:Uncharacterized protein n=1 Tax=Kibdelosporangium phytohabitans TaxID=860235 RepID=A0A0N9HL77_9PSEU|nr:hypothetical protein [Kibdelosporangium phytohabitans]ALG06851.1 hypothetical protein AOZ06_07820 [Kibdelosporangium phytohabitans]MBE1468098.1 hypothetical protein [Kibdelosporangium phytohabitans]
MPPSTSGLLVGKIGSIMIAPYGTTAPFTIPPSGSFDIAAAVLPGAWTAADLGYLHEDDTPEFGFDASSSTITAWQANGNVLRTLLNSKIRSVKFSCREFNRRVWALQEPGTVWTTGANGSYSASIPANGGNPPRAGLFELNDLDVGFKVWWYIPRMTVSAFGAFKAANQDTMNAQFTLNFEAVNSTDPLYYLAGNHPGFAA